MTRRLTLAARVQIAERQFDALPIPKRIDPERYVLERNRAVFRDFVDRESWRRNPAGRNLDFLLRLLFGENAKVRFDAKQQLYRVVENERG